MGEWKKTACYNCGVCCGLEFYIEDNQIVDVRPDNASMRSLGGYCCRKGRAAKYFQKNKNRVDYPMKRVNGEYVRISWEQAMTEIGQKVKEIKANYSPKAFGVYGVGLAADHVPHMSLLDLKDQLGTQWHFNPLSVEFVSPWWATGKVFGRQFPMLDADLENCDVFIAWGANPYVTHQVGNARAVVKAISESPEKMMITVDPCLSETARMSDMHIMPKSGSDALLIRAIIAIIVEKGLEDREFLETYTTGWDKARKWYEGFDWRSALKVCEVPEKQIMDFVKILCTKSWGLHQDLGILFGRHSTISNYLIEELEAVTGNIMRVGTNVFPHCYLSWGPYTDEHTPGTWKTWKTKSFPTISCYNAGAITECMEDPNEDDRLRALFVCCGNPVRTFPDSSRMEKDFKNLDLLVVIDIAMTETARCADYVLPGATGYERFGATIFPGGYPYTTLTFKQQLLELEAERQDEAETFIQIMDASGLLPEIPDELYAKAKKAVADNDRTSILPDVEHYLEGIGRKDALYPVLTKLMAEPMGSWSKANFWAHFIFGELPVINMIYAGLTFPGKHPDMEQDPKWMGPILRDQAFTRVDNSPSGNVIAGAVGTTTQDMLNEFVVYDDKKLHLFDETVDQFIGAITPEKEEKTLALTDEYPFLISAGAHGDDGLNTNMRTPETYVWRQPYVFRMAPEDARAMGFADGQWVRVTTKTGSIKIPIEYSYYSAKGFGNITHHFGLCDETGKAYGDTVNKLTSADDIDEIAGDAVYRWVPCRVEALKEGETYGLWNKAE